MLDQLNAAWRYRHFIVSSIKAEQRARFSRSKLGAIWAILHPLTQSLLFAFVISEVLAARMPNIDNKAAYAVYIMSGMAAWGLFSELITRNLSMFIEYGNSLKKVSFPRICLPLIVLGSALVNHAILLVVTMIVFVFFGQMPSLAWLSLPLGTIIICFLGAGIGVTLGVLNIFSRDIGQFLTIFMQVLFWITPIVYVRELPSDAFRWIVDGNPMTPLVGIYQQAMLNGKWPSLSPISTPVLISVIALACGFKLFRSAAPEIVDAL
jgi:lipopolysaccharide transport system permease protein